MQAARDLLDRLMGPNRNGNFDKKTSEIKDFRDPQVCKLFLLGYCPHDLFQNSRNDMGPCPLIHDEKLRTSFEKDPHKNSYRYEDRLYSVAKQIYIESERRIEDQIRKLEKVGPVLPVKVEENEDVQNKVKVIEALQKKYKELINNGKTTQALDVQHEIQDEILNKAEIQARIIQDSKAMLDKSVTASNAKENQRMRVCDICGATLSAFDSDKRLSDHFIGRSHMGYLAIRNKYLELEKVLSHQTSRDASRRRSRTRSRSSTRHSPSGSRRNRSRSRSRSRSNRRGDERRDRERRDRDRERRDYERSRDHSSRMDGRERERRR
ncbi:hypothetical protein WA158_008382 [Blastocystis sp. Blastoise]